MVHKTAMTFLTNKFFQTVLLLCSIRKFSIFNCFTKAVILENDFLAATFAETFQLLSPILSGYDCCLSLKSNRKRPFTVNFSNDFPTGLMSDGGCKSAWIIQNYFRPSRVKNREATYIKF